MDEEYDLTLASEIFAEYPELLERLDRERAKSFRIVGPGDVIDPKYLHGVVREHRWLTEGPGDQPDPDLERRCRKAAAIWPPVLEQRMDWLHNPFWRGGVRPGRLAEMYDPVYLERCARRQREVATDPFCESNLRWKQIIAALENGGHMTMTEIATGETTDLGYVEPKRGAGALYN